jgi:hypothetical protein
MHRAVGDALMQQSNKSKCWIVRVVLLLKSMRNLSIKVYTCHKNHGQFGEGEQDMDLYFNVPKITHISILLLT